MRRVAGVDAGEPSSAGSWRAAPLRAVDEPPQARAVLGLEALRLRAQVIGQPGGDRVLERVAQLDVTE